MEENETKQCPYCSEEILATAKKCKHCGEWLEESDKVKESKPYEKGSDKSRAVAKGIKQYELDRSSLGCFGVIILGIAIAIGSAIGSDAGLIVGVIVFIVGMVILSKNYHKE